MKHPSISVFFLFFVFFEDTKDRLKNFEEAFMLQNINAKHQRAETLTKNVSYLLCCDVSLIMKFQNCKRESHKFLDSLNHRTEKILLRCWTQKMCRCTASYSWVSCFGADVSARRRLQQRSGAQQPRRRILVLPPRHPSPFPRPRRLRRSRRSGRRATR